MSRINVELSWVWESFITSGPASKPEDRFSHIEAQIHLCNVLMLNTQLTFFSPVGGLRTQHSASSESLSDPLLSSLTLHHCATRVLRGPNMVVHLFYNQSSCVLAETSNNFQAACGFSSSWFRHNAHAYIILMILFCKRKTQLWIRHEISNNVACATNKGSDQPAHSRSLIRSFASRLNILWLLSYWPNIIIPPVRSK